MRYRRSRWLKVPAVRIVVQSRSTSALLQRIKKLLLPFRVQQIHAELDVHIKSEE